MDSCSCGNRQTDMVFLYRQVSPGCTLAVF